MSTVFDPHRLSADSVAASLNEGIAVDSTRPPQSKLKRIGFKLTTTIGSALVAITILLGADLYLHFRYDINLWGYRGPVVGKKLAAEKRVVVVGGSTTWGYGFPYEQSIPAQVQRLLDEHLRSEGGPPISVVNLGLNNDGVYSFKYTLKDYAYLDYDTVVLYSGYNDLTPNMSVGRYRSPLFRWTGYLPLFPAFTVDKISALKVRLTGEREPIVFNPPGGTEPDSNSDTVAKTKLQESLNQLNNSGPNARANQANCDGEWEFYCHELSDVIELSLARAKRVMVVTEPYMNGKHVEQQQAIENMLKTRFAGAANLQYLNLGNTVDLRDPSLCWDGMHLTPKGNRRIAEALAQTVWESLGDKPSRPLPKRSEQDAPEPAGK